jgi:hypothetical protein
VSYNFPVGSGGVTLDEGFLDVTNLPGWVTQNNSNPIGITGWFQGNPENYFSAQSGNPESYIAADTNNATGVGTISNWLITPVLTLQNGGQFVFWTRTDDPPVQFPDRLQIRMSTNGSSTNVGTTATSVGDFTTLLLDINPAYTLSGYPTVWTRFTVNITTIVNPVQGRLAFRYFVENGGPDGANSDFIGIDTVSYSRTLNCCGLSTPTPTPTPTPTATPTPTVPPTPTSAVSRKTHGVSGTFDVSLPLSGSAGIECRTGGATSDYTMVVTFPSFVTVNGNPQAQVIAGTGLIGSGGASNGGAVTLSGNNVIVPLTSVTNAQTIQVRLNGVTGGAGSGNVTISMSVLIADTNGNTTVNSGDVIQTKSRLGTVLDSTNFRSDVNANGSINAGDVTIVKSAIGTGLP